MKFLHTLESVCYFSINRCGQCSHPSLLVQGTELVLHDLRIDLLVELAEIEEDGVHLLELVDDEVALANHGLDGDATTHEHLIHSHELS